MNFEKWIFNANGRLCVGLAKDLTLFRLGLSSCVHVFWVYFRSQSPATYPWGCALTVTLYFLCRPSRPFHYFAYDSTVDIQCGPFVAAQAQNCCPYDFGAVTSSAYRHQQNCMDLLWSARHFVAVAAVAGVFEKN